MQIHYTYRNITLDILSSGTETLIENKHSIITKHAGLRNYFSLPEKPTFWRAVLAGMTLPLRTVNFKNK